MRDIKRTKYTHLSRLHFTLNSRRCGSHCAPRLVPPCVCLIYVVTYVHEISSGTRESNNNKGSNHSTSVTLQQKQQKQSLPLSMELKRGWQTVLHALLIDANCIRLQSNLWTFDWLADCLSDWVTGRVSAAWHFILIDMRLLIFYIICIKCENSVSASWQFLKFESRQCCRCYRRCCCWCCCCCWEAIKADSVHCWLANRTEPDNEWIPLNSPAIA